MHIFRKRKRGGGISIYVRSKRVYSSIKMFNIISNDYEFQFIKISKKYTNISKNLVVGTCYRPPSGDMDNFLIKLNEINENLDGLNSFQYVIGDFNIDVLKKDTDQDIQLFLTQQVVSATIPTRISFFLYFNR